MVDTDPDGGSSAIFICFPRLVKRESHKWLLADGGRAMPKRSLIASSKSHVNLDTFHIQNTNLKFARPDQGINSDYTRKRLAVSYHVIDNVTANGWIKARGNQPQFTIVPACHLRKASTHLDVAACAHPTNILLINLPHLVVGNDTLIKGTESRYISGWGLDRADL